MREVYKVVRAQQENDHFLFYSALAGGENTITYTLDETIQRDTSPMFVFSKYENALSYARNMYGLSIQIAYDNAGVAILTCRADKFLSLATIDKRVLTVGYLENKSMVDAFWKNPTHILNWGLTDAIPPGTALCYELTPHRIAYMHERHNEK